MNSIKFYKLQINCIRDYNEELIDGIYYSSITAQSSLEKELIKRQERIESNESLSDDEKQFEMEFLEDDYFESTLIKELSEEMVIIALYKTVEIVIKKMLNRSRLFTDEELQKFYIAKKLYKHVKDKIVDIEALQGYSSYNELRCINNSVKHEGVVGAELAGFTGWVEKEKISNLWQHYNRLKPSVRDFVYNLSDEIVAKL